MPRHAIDAAARTSRVTYIATIHAPRGARAQWRRLTVPAGLAGTLPGQRDTRLGGLGAPDGHDHSAPGERHGADPVHTRHRVRDPPPSLLRPKFSAPDKTLLDPGRQTRWEAGRERRQLPQLPGAAQTPPSTTGMRWPSSLTSLFLVEAPRGSTETRSAQCTGPRPDSLKQSTVGRLARGPGTSNDVQLTFFPAAPAPPALSQPYLPRYRALGLELYGFVGNVGG